jgi:hypothetical protein
MRPRVAPPLRDDQAWDRKHAEAEVLLCMALCAAEKASASKRQMRILPQGRDAASGRTLDPAVTLLTTQTLGPRSLL